MGRVTGKRALKPVWSKVRRGARFMRVSLYKEGSKGRPTVKYIHRLVAAAGECECGVLRVVSGTPGSL